MLMWSVGRKVGRWLVGRVCEVQSDATHPTLPTRALAHTNHEPNHSLSRTHGSVCRQEQASKQVRELIVGLVG